MKTTKPSASAHLEILNGFYKNCPMFKGIPCLPVPAGYVKHETIQAMLGTETMKPFVAVRGIEECQSTVNTGLTQEESIRLGQDPSVDCWTSSCANYALSNNAPLIHVTADLAQAFSVTNPSSEPSDYRMPFPSFILSLPTGLIKDSDGGHFNFIMVSSTFEVAAWWHSLGRAFTYWGLVNHQANDFYLCGYSLASGCQYMPMKWQDISMACQGAFDDGGGHNWVAPDLSDQYNFSTLCRIACNAILAINHSPELFYEEATEVRRNPGFGKDSIYKGPIRWLGKNYKHDRSTTNAELTGKSCRPHWRRGHWHMVLYGAQRALRKLQWFQPTYVNGQGED